MFIDHTLTPDANTKCPPTTKMSEFIIPHFEFKFGSRFGDIGATAGSVATKYSLMLTDIQYYATHTKFFIRDAEKQKASNDIRYQCGTMVKTVMTTMAIDITKTELNNLEDIPDIEKLMSGDMNESIDYDEDGWPLLMVDCVETTAYGIKFRYPQTPS